MTDDETTGRDPTDDRENPTDDREQGIDFGELDGALDAASYPTILDELLAEHGDVELRTGDETTTLRAVLEPLGDDEYDSAEAVRQAVFTMVDREAVGRQRYTDRGAPSAGEDDDGLSTDESL